MTNFQGAILAAQLERLEELAERRAENGRKLDGALAGVEGILPQGDDPDGRHSRYMHLFLYQAEAFGGLSRADFVARLDAVGVPAKPIYPAVQDTRFFPEHRHAQGFNGPLPETPVSRRIAAEGVWIHHRCLIGSEEQALQVADAIRGVQTSERRRHAVGA